MSSWQAEDTKVNKTIIYGNAACDRARLHASDNPLTKLTLVKVFIEQMKVVSTLIVLQ